MKKFSGEILKELKYYVYLISDPNGNVLYVGKGKNNRVFQHFDKKNKSDIAIKIKNLEEKGETAKIEFLVHGIEDENTVKKIEAGIIDLIGVDNLLNKQSGYESTNFGRMSYDQIVAKYSSKRKNITEKVVLIKLSETFSYNMDPMQMYDYTRGIWRISEERRNTTKYAFTIYDGIVQETYKILEWFKATSTFSNRIHRSEWQGDRWEFVGNIDLDMRKKYQYNSVAHYWTSGNRNPIRFTY